METILIDNYKVVLSVLKNYYKFIVSYCGMIIDEIIFNLDEFVSIEEAREYAYEYVDSHSGFSFEE